MVSPETLVTPRPPSTELDEPMTLALIYFPGYDRKWLRSLIVMASFSRFRTAGHFRHKTTTNSREIGSRIDRNPVPCFPCFSNYSFYDDFSILCA
jgi:hypothetical protein